MRTTRQPEQCEDKDFDLGLTFEEEHKPPVGSTISEDKDFDNLGLAFEEEQKSPAESTILLADDMRTNGTLIDAAISDGNILATCLGYIDDKIVYNKKITFFGNLKLLKHQEQLDLQDAAKHILRGRLDEAESLVKRTPSILDYTIEAKDPCDRRVKGTLLQLAAMAGDFNLEQKAAEKDDGMVERLALAGGVSKEEVAKQLHAVLFSEEAKRENEKRKQHVLEALKEFAEGLIKLKQAKVQEFKNGEATAVHIDLYTGSQYSKFIKTLNPDPNKVITLGYIFDTQILCDAMQWFEDKKNLDRLGGWQSTESSCFLINGFGLLQRVVSARDAHVLGEGVDELRLPRRTNNSDFFDASSRLGIDFFLGRYGGRLTQEAPEIETLETLAASNGAYENLCRVKTAALQTLCNLQSPEAIYATTPDKPR